jgi:hypothetical protein
MTERFCCFTPGEEEAIMIRTVIGIFENTGDAENAVERLVNSGYDRGLIDVARNSSAVEDQTQSAAGTCIDDETKSDRITNFFGALFDDENETYKYSAIARDAAAVVSVQANGEREGARITEILDECGAIDVDEKAKGYHFPAPTSLERDDFSGSDEVARQLASKDIPGESRNVPVESQEKRQPGAEPKTRSRIIEGPVEEEKRLREERVAVDKSHKK